MYIGQLLSETRKKTRNKNLEKKEYSYFLPQSDYKAMKTK